MPYVQFGVTPRINAAGLLTRLGGSLMDEEVLAAMREAARSFVDMAELQTAASRVLARHTGAEAGVVTSGAAAALTLATAACLARDDVVRMERLPDTVGMPNEVIIYRGHRTGYDHAIRAAGAVLVEVGFNDRDTGAGVRGLEAWEIEAAVSPRTVAVAYTATTRMQPPLTAVAAVARRHGLPVIVDAAAQLPPKDNLRRFVAEGAALVCYSGGKAIRGPQGTGLLVGEEALVASALVQMLDMDMLVETLTVGSLLSRFPHVPHHGIGRGFKVDKESIIGLLVALERFANADIAKEIAAKGDILAAVAAGLGGVAGLTVLPRDGAPDRFPALALRVDATALGFDAVEASRRLQRCDPPVHLGEGRIDEGVLLVDSSGLRPGDVPALLSAFKTVFR